MASQKGHADVVQLLLDHGADADKARTTDGATPLFMASQKGHADVVQLLLEHGADADKAETTTGSTPLFAASGHGTPTWYSCCSITAPMQTAFARILQRRLLLHARKGLPTWQRCCLSTAPTPRCTHGGARR